MTDGDQLSAFHTFKKIYESSQAGDDDIFLICLQHVFYGWLLSYLYCILASEFWFVLILIVKLCMFKFSCYQDDLLLFV